MIAKVVVDVAVDKEFDYLIPDTLARQVKLGSRVNVSFGSRKTQRYPDVRTLPAITKYITRIIDSSVFNEYYDFREDNFAFHCLHRAVPPSIP
ncbi:MAG: hypothetical protein WCO77_06385 [bacterium]